MGIRSLYSPCSKPHGTCFSLDSTTFAMGSLSAGQMMQFERNLAAIIAATQPVSNKRNPFFFNKFYGSDPLGVTWTEQHWNCKDNCHAADVLAHPNDANVWAMNHHFQEPTPGAVWGPSGVRRDGCSMCQAMFDGKVETKCHNHTTDELMIAIINSNFDDQPPIGASPPCSNMNRVMIGINPAANLMDMAGWVAPNGLAYQVNVLSSSPNVLIHILIIIPEKKY